MTKTEMNKCKYCNSENLILEPQVKGQDVMTANVVALKCGDCGKWLKWCPKDERKYHFQAVKQNKEYGEQTKCPICGYEIKDCQCYFGGSAHPNRSKRREVVQDHLYLLSEKQLAHLIKLQAYWQTSYGDEERSKILGDLINAETVIENV